MRPQPWRQPHRQREQTRRRRPLSFRVARQSPIEGADTAVTAFVGRTLWGPTGTPTEVDSLDYYVDTFGYLDSRFPLGQAVADFFNNGGSRAIVLRLVGADAEASGTASIAIGPIRLKALEPGAWGNTLKAGVVETDVGFSLAIVGEGLTEGHFIRFDGPHPINTQFATSRLVRWDGDAPATDAQAVAADLTSFSGGTGGLSLTSADYLGDGATGGINALAGAAFNLLCVPADQPGGDTDTSVWQAAHALCIQRRAVLIADAPAAWQTATDAETGLNATGLAGASNATLYFPRVLVPDPIENTPRPVVACGAVAGVYARTDAARGVWVSPAGLNATVLGASDLAVAVNDATATALTSLNVNTLRRFNGAAPVVFGARTLNSWSEYRYVNVLRMSQFIENSVRAGLSWVPTAPDGEGTWSQMRALVSTFLNDLFRQGAFQGVKPADAFFVRCDAMTTAPIDVLFGRVNMLIGFAPLKPAEFVLIQISWQPRG